MSPTHSVLSVPQICQPRGSATPLLAHLCPFLPRWEAPAQGGGAVSSHLGQDKSGCTHMCWSLHVESLLGTAGVHWRGPGPETVARHVLVEAHPAGVGV